MDKVRIVKIEYRTGSVLYEIQKNSIWGWVPARKGNRDQKGSYYETLEEARENLWRYDGTPFKKETVIE